MVKANDCSCQKVKFVIFVYVLVTYATKTFFIIYVLVSRV